MDIGLQNVFTGGLLGVALNKQTKEKFDDAKKLGTGMVVFIIVLVVLVLLLLAISSYRIMGGSILHAILSVIFGSLYLFLVWIWAGMFARLQLKK